MPDKFDMVNHPPHYAPIDGIDFECIELTRRLTFDVGNAVKYIWRTEQKNGREDIEKAQWYIRDAIANNDWIYGWFRLSQREKTDLLLGKCIRAQNDPTRRRFFNSIRDGRLDLALEALEEMLS